MTGAEEQQPEHGPDDVLDPLEQRGSRRVSSGHRLTPSSGMSPIDGHVNLLRQQAEEIRNHLEPHEITLAQQNGIGHALMRHRDVRENHLVDLAPLDAAGQVVERPANQFRRDIRIRRGIVGAQEGDDTGPQQRLVFQRPLDMGGHPVDSEHNHAVDLLPVARQVPFDSEQYPALRQHQERGGEEGQSHNETRERRIRFPPERIRQRYGQQNAPPRRANQPRDLIAERADLRPDIEVKRLKDEQKQYGAHSRSVDVEHGRRHPVVKEGYPSAVKTDPRRQNESAEYGRRIGDDGHRAAHDVECIPFAHPAILYPRFDRLQTPKTIKATGPVCSGSVPSRLKLATNPPSRNDSARVTAQVAAPRRAAT